MPPFTDYLKMGVTKPSSNMVPKKGRSDLTEVSQATPNPVKTIAQGTASTAPLGMNSKIQNLANIPKMSVTKSPFNFTNLIGQQQGGLPNTDFLKMGMQGPTQQGMQEFNTRLDDANTSIKDNKRQFVERVAKGGVITRKEIEEQMSGFDDNKKREFLSVLGQSNAKIEGIDFNNEPKEGFTIGNTDISVNPIKQAGEKILEAKEYLKNNPQADPIMKTLLQGIISSFDPTGGLATSGLMQTDAVNDILPKTDNPLTQGVMGFAGNTTRGVGQVIEGGAGLVDKAIAGTQSLVQGGDMSQYQTRQTGIGEDIFDIGAGATQSLASIYAMPSSLLIGAGIEALPPEGQKVVSDTMIGLGDIIAKTPGLKQWMESLPPERRDEFKAELAGATVGLRWGLKNKGNIIKDPKLFIKENLNPVQMAKNFNENVIGIPSKALDMAVSTVGKIDLPEVNIPTVKVPKAVSNKVDMVFEQLEGVGKAKKEGIQNNPYSKEIYSKVIEDIDNGNAPQNFKEMQEPYTKRVVEELDTILDDVKSQKGEGGEAFNLLRQDQTPIDTTVEINSMNDLLKGTDYSLKTFLNRVDKGNLLGTRKILDNTATISTLHDIRKGLDDLMVKAQANKDSGEFKILKNMRKIIDGKLKENPDRVKADEEWARISKDIQEIEEGITYREQRKKGQIRDNIDSIIENINNPAKAKLRERLLQYMPDIGERISAIRGIPEIAKAYTTIPQGVIGRVAGALGGVALGSTGGIPGMILGGIAGLFADVGLSQLRRNSIKKAIAKQSPKALEKLGEIQKSIANGKKLRADQVIELQNFTNNLKKSLPANDKELISKVSELPKIIKTSLVPVKEGVLESRGYTQKLTSPKREITEINPMAGKKYTAQDLLQEVRAKKKDNTLDNNISKNEQTLKTTRGVDTKDSGYSDKSTSLTKINESEVVPNRKRRFSAEQVKEQYKEIERLNKQSEMYYDVSQNLGGQEFEDYLSTVTDPEYLKKPMTFDEYKSKIQKYQEQAMQEIRNSDPMIKEREDDVSKVMMLERREQRIDMVGKNKLSREEVNKNVRQLEKDKERMRESLAEKYGGDGTDLYDKAVASITAKTKEPKYTSNFGKTKEEIDIQRQNKRVLKESQKKSANKKLSDSLLNKLNNPKKSVQSDTLVSKSDSMGNDNIKSIKEKYKDSKITVFEGDKEMTIYRVEVPSEKRGQGVGTKIMNDIVSYADKNGKDIYLSPDDYAGSSISRLTNFYKKFGFVENKGKNYDGSISEKMYRKSKKPVQSDTLVSKSDEMSNLDVLKDYKPKGYNYKIQDIDVKLTNSHKTDNYYKDLPNYGESKSVKYREQQIDNGSSVPPIVVSKTDDGFYIIDGYHRAYAQNNKGIRDIKALVIDGLGKPPYKNNDIFTKFSSSELDNLKMKPSISKDLQPLYEEAKKFKTADTFVESNGYPIEKPLEPKGYYALYDNLGESAQSSIKKDGYSLVEPSKTELAKYRKELAKYEEGLKLRDIYKEVERDGLIFSRKSDVKGVKGQRTFDRSSQPGYVDNFKGGGTEYILDNGNRISVQAGRDHIAGIIIKDKGLGDGTVFMKNYIDEYFSNPYHKEISITQQLNPKSRSFFERLGFKFEPGESDSLPITRKSREEVNKK